MDVNGCLDAAWEKYQNELRIADDMVRKGNIEEDEIFSLRKMLCKFYEEDVERCYQEFEGRSTPGRNRR